MLQYGLIDTVHRPQNALTSSSSTLTSRNNIVTASSSIHTSRNNLIPFTSNPSNTTRDNINEFHENNDFKSLIRTFKKIEENDNNDNDNNEITINNDIDFLKNFISVKNKLISMKDKSKNIKNEINIIHEYIKKLELLRTKIQETDINYDECFTFVSKDLNPKQEKMNKDYEEISMKKINNINDAILYSQKLISENDLKIYELQNGIKELQNMIRLKEIIETIEFEKEQDNPDNKNKIICNICCEKRIEFCVNPCGHCYCVDCNNQLLLNCHTCRGPVNSKIKIYYE